MNQIIIFIIRLFMSLICAIMLTRLFHPEKGSGFIAGIAVIMMALSYLFAFMRAKGRKE